MTISQHPVHRGVHTEEDRIPNRPVLFVLLVTIAIGMALSFWVHRILANREQALRPSGFPERGLSLRSEVSQTEETLIEHEPPARTDAMQRSQLDEYGWVDRNRRTVSIPIHRAMEIVIDRSRKGGGK